MVVIAVDQPNAAHLGFRTLTTDEDPFDLQFLNHGDGVTIL